MSGKYNWVTLFLGDINMGTWPSRLGESQMRQYNMVMRPFGFGPEKDCAGEDQLLLQALSLVREGAQHQQTRNCLKIYIHIKKEVSLSHPVELQIQQLH
jgi:hypothetical protein